MKDQQPHILCLGEWGFPIGFGGIQRLRLIAKGMIKHGCKVTVVSFKGSHGPDHDFPPQGMFEGIQYRYTSGTIHRPRGGLERNWLKIVGRVKELIYIRKMKQEGSLAGCLVSTMFMDVFMIYWIWFKILGIPLIINYDELNSEIPTRSGRLNRFNDYLFDRFVPRLADGICPISKYLIDHIKQYSPNKPILKLPVLCEFEKFNVTKDQVIENDGETTFMYCGAALYIELIRFVLRSFDYLDIQGKPVYLDFILGGSVSELNRVKEEISLMRNCRQIRLHSNVPHQSIPGYYAGSSALLIPLRPTIQDAARFPHKIGEYLASNRPVITTRYGEILHYDFIDEQSALIADDYEPETYSHKMKFVLDHPERARDIGSKGREMGIRNFNYVDIGGRVRDFIIELNK